MALNLEPLSRTMGSQTVWQSVGLKHTWGWWQMQKRHQLLRLGRGHWKKLRASWASKAQVPRRLRFPHPRPHPSSRLLRFRLWDEPGAPMVRDVAVSAGEMEMMQAWLVCLHRSYITIPVFTGSMASQTLCHLQAQRRNAGRGDSWSSCKPMVEFSSPSKTTGTV